MGVEQDALDQVRAYREKIRQREQHGLQLRLEHDAAVAEFIAAATKHGVPTVRLYDTRVVGTVNRRWGRRSQPVREDVLAGTGWVYGSGEFGHPTYVLMRNGSAVAADRISEGCYAVTTAPAVPPSRANLVYLMSNHLSRRS